MFPGFFMLAVCDFSVKGKSGCSAVRVPREGVRLEFECEKERVGELCVL